MAVSLLCCGAGLTGWLGNCGLNDHVAILQCFISDNSHWVWNINSFNGTFNQNSAVLIQKIFPDILA
jgi:hypothetical protein